MARGAAAYLFLCDRLHDGSEGRDGGYSDRAEEHSVPTQVSQSLVGPANVQKPHAHFIFCRSSRAVGHPNG